MTEIVVGPLTDEDRAAARALLDAVQGVRTSEAEFAWWFERSPAGPAKLLTAKLSGEVVGVYAMLPFRMRLGGVEQVVHFAQKLVVDERTRGKGLFSRMQAAFEAQLLAERTPVFLGFPNEKAHPIWVGKLGALDLPPHRLWLRLLRPSALLRRLKAPRPISRIMDVPYQAIAGRRKPAVSQDGLVFRAIDRFAPFANDVDALSRSALPSVNGAREGDVAELVRSSAHLDWRYLDAPSGRYRATGAWAKGTLAGYVITGEMEKWGARLGFVVDLFAGSKKVRSALLDRALDELSEAGAEGVAMLAPRTISDRLAMVRRGFLPTPRRFPMIGKVLDGNAATIAALQKPGGLAFALGDLDFF